jgi:hypothetical protein
MKIQKNEPTKTFQPISITITIESGEELNSIKKLAGYNATISKYFLTLILKLSKLSTSFSRNSTELSEIIL